MAKFKFGTTSYKHKNFIWNTFTFRTANANARKDPKKKLKKTCR